MATEAKDVKFRNQMKAFDAHRAEMKKEPEKRDASKLMEPRDVIQIRNRCRI